MVMNEAKEMLGGASEVQRFTYRKNVLPPVQPRSKTLEVVLSNDGRWN
jgi:hypothetical protein